MITTFIHSKNKSAPCLICNHFRRHGIIVFSDHYFEWPPFLLSQSHCKSSSHLLTGRPALLSVSVEIRSPRFSLGGFSGPSGFLVAIRKACRHFSFFCVSTPICDAACQHFFISFFRASFHVSLLNRLLVLLCCLHQHRMKYCCLGRIHHVCCLLLEYPRLFRRHECHFLQVLFLFVFSPCLDDESMHSALCSAEQFLSCSFIVAHVPGTARYCWCDNSVE